MLRIAILVVMMAASGALAAERRPPAEPPVLYELMLDGESFTIEGNRLVKLESKEKPGVSHQVAVRVAPVQRLRLNTLQFDYDGQCKVEHTGDQEQPGVRLRHARGYNLLITDLGGPLESDARDEALKILVESATEGFKDRKAKDLETGKPHDRKFNAAAGRGVVIRYRDANGFAHSSLVYVLVGEKFTASCIAQYLDNDADDVLPLVRQTLDSFRPAR